MNFIVRSIALVGLLVLGSCSALMKYDHPHGMNEIADHPQILYDGTVPRTEMALRGVKLDDPGFAIRRGRELRQSEEWVICRDGARYRVVEGKVITLGVWDPSILDQLHITSPADIEKRFGKPDKIDDLQQLLVYRYAGGSLNVLWNKQEDQLNAVNVSK